MEFAAKLEGSSPTFFVPLEMVSFKMVWLDPIISKVKTGGKDWKRKPWKKLFAGSNLVFMSLFGKCLFSYATKVWNTSGDIGHSY